MQLYKANKSNKGAACSFGFNSKDGALFTQIVKQVSYDESRHIGSFSGGEKIVIKSGITEIGAFLDVLQRNVEYSTVHTTKDGTTQIWFAPYVVEADGVKTQKGYGLRVARKSSDGKESKFLMPFNFGEAAALKVYLDFVLRHIFSADYAEEKKNYKEKLKVKDAKVTTPVESSEASSPDVQEEI